MHFKPAISAFYKASKITKVHFRCKKLRTCFGALEKRADYTARRAQLYA